MPPPPPPLSIDTNRGNQQQDNRAPSSSKIAASIHQSMAWTTSDTRYKSAGFTATSETSPTDYLMNDDSIPDEQVHLSDDEDTRNDHLPKANMRNDWWKPLPKEERPATPEPAWTIPSSNVSDVENNWTSALVSTYEPPVVNSLLAKTGDMITFMNWYCQKANPEGDQVRIDVSRPLPLSGPPVPLMVSLIGGLIVRNSTLTDTPVTQAARLADHQEYMIPKKDFKNLYPSDFEDLNLMLLQGHLNHLPGSDIRYEYKHDYTIIESPRAVVFLVSNNEWKIIRFNEIYKFSDGTLTNILEALDYRVKEYKVNLFNPGMNMWFWTAKAMTRSKEFIHAIEQRLKTRRIYRNLECFVGGRVYDIDYRLL
ncbi:hypothetical protein Tco_0464873 [Tanacetum coccineum]